MNMIETSESEGREYKSRLISPFVKRRRSR
jgi:hypothetical protein